MRKPLHRILPATLALAAGLALGGCEATRSALDSVSETSKQMWDSVSAPFSREGSASASRDPTLERRADVEHWERIRGSDDPAVFQAFIERYPDSALTHLARRRLASLQPTQGAQTPASLVGGQPPAPPTVSATGGAMPPEAPPGQFPAPWVLGRWAIDCSTRDGGSGVTYVQTEGGKVRVVRDDGSSAVYAIRREGDVLVLDGNGLIYQDKIVSATQLRSYAVRYNGQWHKVDLTYRKCD